MHFRRYAIYYGPRRENPLASFGREWFGTDPETGESQGAIPLVGYSAEEHAALMETPRRYALHGTLKPPFVLAPNYTFNDVTRAVTDLATSLAPLSLGFLELKKLGGFLALCPKAPIETLSTLAARCVTELDEFRSPPSNAELEKRRSVGLTKKQDGYLSDWGYPYVLDEFRFHVTLTGRLDQAEGERVYQALRERLYNVTSVEHSIEDLCIYGEPVDGSPFRIVERIPLTGQ